MRRKFWLPLRRTARVVPTFVAMTRLHQEALRTLYLLGVVSQRRCGCALCNVPLRQRRFWLAEQRKVS